MLVCAKRTSPLCLQSLRRCDSFRKYSSFRVFCGDVQRGNAGLLGLVYVLLDIYLNVVPKVPTYQEKQCFPTLLFLFFSFFTKQPYVLLNIDQEILIYSLFCYQASCFYEDIDSKLVFQLAHAGQAPIVFYADTETAAEK